MCQRSQQKGVGTAMENNEEIKEDEKLSVEDKEFFTVTELAEIIGLSRQRIHQVIHAGILKPDIVTPFCLVFRRSTLQRFIEKRAKKAGVKVVKI